MKYLFVQRDKVGDIDKNNLYLQTEEELGETNTQTRNRFITNIEMANS